MSIIKKLREEKRSNEEFEIMMRHLTLEEIFFLRLELEDKAFRNNLNGYKIYHMMRQIINEGLIRFALELKVTKMGASRFLGINLQTLEMAMLRLKMPVKKRHLLKAPPRDLT